MSATDAPNGRDLQSLEPIRHNYDRVGETVLAVCVECGTEGSRELQRRDYDEEEDFKQSLVEGDHSHIPSQLWRFCEECWEKQTHLVI